MSTRTAATWQEELAKECEQRKIQPPIYNIVSDRRGGRTAWSATVTIQSNNIAARYWYDGQYLNNAKEDAAEVGATRLRNPAITSGGGVNRDFGRTRMTVASFAAEEEKEEPGEEPLPEGAIARRGEEILD